MSRTTLRQDEEFAKALSENMDVEASFGLDWVKSNFSPGDVFDLSTLKEWAEDNDYIKA